MCVDSSAHALYPDGGIHAGGAHHRVEMKWTWKDKCALTLFAAYALVMFVPYMLYAAVFEKPSGREWR
jgi:hypothetical protein